MLALIPLFPLIGFLVNGVWYAFGQAPKGCKKASAQFTGWIASFFIFLSFVVSTLLFFKLSHLDAEHRVIEQFIYHWITIGQFNLDVTFRVDSLSTLFTLVITGVGTLIHVYSIGYMSHDETPGRFFAYLNLFCFAMLVLVLGGSLPLLFLGWEGVGLCSYLLIGYWYEDIEKAKAGKKAFIVNRIGDLGFLLGMFLTFSTFGSLDFETLRQTLSHLGDHLPSGVTPQTITTICILLFVGCMGKSAQIPLYVWLPDAMAGPTPVSALIHAATMVTSGVYLVSRLNYLYVLSPSALHVVAIIGVLTAFFAATIALVQKDIKKILAYSTVSQLGYMFLACGVGAFTAGVFHVITHAFFKALLFLGAGSVIHGMFEEQDIFKMGGLKSKMPKTYLTFVAGWLAISGIPVFSGFFSKDEILWQSYSSPHGSTWLWALASLTAIMTAFYMTRLFSLTFLGDSRFSEKKLMKHSHQQEESHAIDEDHNSSKKGIVQKDHSHHEKPGQGGHGVHESPWMMTIPLMILAFLSTVGGFLGIPHVSWIENYLEPVIPSHHALKLGVSPHTEWLLMGVSVLGSAFGILIALKFYRNLNDVKSLAQQFSGLHRLLENKWYVDEIYQKAIVSPIQNFSKFLWKNFDVAVIDKIVLSFGRVSEWTGQTIRLIQTGSIQVYALMLLLGLVVTAGYLIYGWV